MRQQLALVGIAAALVGLLGASGAEAPVYVDLPRADSRVRHVAVGRDGTVWFTANKPRIGRVSREGKVAEIGVKNADAEPAVISVGPDTVWVGADRSLMSGELIRVTAAGEVSEIDVGSAPGDVLATADGGAWFTLSMADQVGRITKAGTITLYKAPGYPTGLALGPDGNVWVTLTLGHRIGRLTPRGELTQFAVPSMDAEPDRIVAGPDGNLWFTESKGGNIGRITPAGLFREFPLPKSDEIRIGWRTSIAVGPDRNLWFTVPGGMTFFRMTTAGVMVPTTIDAYAVGYAFAPDGTLWFAHPLSNQLGRIAGKSR